MIKILINNEEVVSDSTLQIKEEMLSTSSTILKNCYPKSWEETKDYTSNFYFPKDYSKCKITDVDYYPPVIGTRVNGTNLNINYNNELKWDLEELQGNTIQDGTPTPDSPVEVQTVTGEQNVNVNSGKNLFNNNGTMYQSTGATVETIDTGIRATILRKGNNRYGKVVIPNSNELLGKTVTLSANFNSSASNTGRIALYQISSTGGVISGIGMLDNTGSITLTIPSEYSTNAVALALLFYANVSGTSEVNDYVDYTNVQLELGSSATEYEEYIGQDYKINLGKNLFNKYGDFTYGNQYNETSLNSQGQIVSTSNYRLHRSSGILITNFKQNTDYTMSGVLISATGTDTGNNANIEIRTTSNTQLTIYTFRASWTKPYNFTFTFNTGDNTSLWFSFNGRNQSSSDTTPLETIFDNIQIEKGSQATSYSPYFTPIELCKIGDYQDRIYKQNDTWYIEKQIGKVVFDGSENFSKSSSTSADIFSYNLNNGDTNGTTETKSNYFEYANKNVVGSCRKYNAYIYLIPTTYGNLTIEQFKTWLSTHNTTLYYVLETPTYTEITDEELINTLNSIELVNGNNNISVSSAYLPASLQIYYNYREESTTEDLLFCGVVKNTGNISLNPREPHYVDLQVLDFKTFLSEGETLNFVINNKTIVEAIQQVIDAISDYGFVLGNIQILSPDDMINAYSTLNKTAYDVFQYIADVTQSRWTTRMVDEDTVAIDFYDPSLMPQASPIENTQEYMCNNKIVNMSFNYSTNDYRNKQIMTSDEVFANITQAETIIADGYSKSFMAQNKIGTIESITVNGVNQTVATKSEADLGVSADFTYTPGEMTFTSKNTPASGSIIIITYYAIVKGREIILNTSEINRIGNQIDRKGVISRYENRNDTLSSNELIKIGQSYIKYKGSAEITLKIVSENELFNVGQIVKYNAPLEELSTNYMVKSKTIEMYLNANRVFYTYELSSNFNSENAINYFDNQRAKNQGNLGQGETITRNIDLESTALIQFYDTQIQEIQLQNLTSLDFELDGALI